MYLHFVPQFGQTPTTPTVAEVIRQDFFSPTLGQVDFVVTEPFPANLGLVRVFRDGLLINVGIDYNIDAGTNKITLIDPIVDTNEVINVIWMPTVGEQFRQDYSPTTGTTVLNITVNGGTVPTSERIFVYRSGLLVSETNDYTVVGNVVTLLSPSVASEQFTIIFNI